MEEKKMKISKIMLFIAVLVLLVGAVSASSISSDADSDVDAAETVEDIQTVSQTDSIAHKSNVNNNIVKDKSNEKKAIASGSIQKDEDNANIKQATLTANSWETFVTAFNEAKTKTEDTIIFLEEGTYINNGTLTWNYSNIALTINGNNQTIDGNQRQVFTIEDGCSLVLKNITITNGLAGYGGAIRNYGNLTVVHSTLKNNKANQDGGAIYNNGATLTVTNSTLNNNTAIGYGGAIYRANGNRRYFDVIGCNFTQNHAYYGAAIYSGGFLNATGNNFIENTAGNKETIDLYGLWNGLFDDNHYYSTDISLSEIKLSVKDDKQSFIYGENVELEFNLQPTNINYYMDFADGINDITLYIKGEKNITTRYENYTLSGLEPGEYDVYFTSCNQQSNTVTFRVIGDMDVNVSDYDKLVEAIGNATRDEYNIYKINLLPGIYNANQNITWKDSATKNIIINGNNNTLNGQNTYHFINIAEGHNLTLENITITNYTAIKGGAISNNGTLTVVNSTLNNNNAIEGGAINNKGNLTISGSTFKDNQATGGYGGAICNGYGTLTISDSIFQDNTADYASGGAIYDFSFYIWTNVSSCNFTNNTANTGAAISACGWVNLTDNTFKENTATGNKETIDINGYGEFDGNSYEYTDVNLTEINLSVKDEKQSFVFGEDIILNFTIQPTHTDYYKDLSEGINDITLYINGDKNVTVKYANYTLKGLKPGKYNVNFTSCNSWSNTVTFTVTGDSEITTDKESYDYYEGIKNMVQLDITDESGLRGTANVSVKDGDEYIELLTCHNVKDGYTIQTATLAEALENIYDNLDSSYTINVTYYSDCANPSSTEFTLNIIKQRNTSITYDIINNTEGNVQINITVIDIVYNTPIAYSQIEVTGNITKTTTSGVLTDNTLTPGDYTINVTYAETEEYTQSKTTIDFTVEIDKDKKIAELEDNITELTNQLEELNNKTNNLTSQLEEAKTQINTLNDTVNNLTQDLKSANNTIKELNNTVNNLIKENKKLNDSVKNLTNLNKQLEAKNKNLTETIKQLENNIKTLENTISQLESIIEELNKTPTKNKTILTVSKVTGKVGTVAKLKATVTDSNGKFVTDGNVLFKVNGITLKDDDGNIVYGPVDKGVATITYTIQKSWYKNTTTVEAVYAGNSRYLASRANNSKNSITPGNINIKIDDLTSHENGDSINFIVT
ncbi:MAG: hypothetical protein Q4Q22_01320, partial [Methanosphaera sp.]|nr:hypothetical protein [Methanosphaera sp.]